MFSDPCLPSNIWQESVLALDITTGIPNWIRQLSPIDVWNAACGVPGYFERNETLCPGAFGPDADFGMAPAFVPGSALTSRQGRRCRRIKEWPPLRLKCSSWIYPVVHPDFSRWHPRRLDLGYCRR